METSWFLSQKIICLGSLSFFIFRSSINQWNTFCKFSLFGIHCDEILIFFLDGESKIMVLLAWKHKSFIIFLLCTGPDVAVKAAIDAEGQRDLSSPILENHTRKGSSSPSLSPLKKIVHYIIQVLWKFIENWHCKVYYINWP